MNSARKQETSPIAAAAAVDAASFVEEGEAFRALVGGPRSAPRERLDVVVRQAFLVAGYSTRPNTGDEPVLRESYQWEAIRAHVRDLYFLNSVEDEFGCDAIGIHEREILLLSVIGPETSVKALTAGLRSSSRDQQRIDYSVQLGTVQLRTR